MPTFLVQFEVTRQRTIKIVAEDEDQAWLSANTWDFDAVEAASEPVPDSTQVEVVEVTKLHD